MNMNGQSSDAAQHGDVTAFLQAGVPDRTPSGAIEFPRRGALGDGHGALRQSSNSQRQMPDIRLGRPHLEFDVIAQARQAIHQLALGKIAEVATHHVRNLCLRDSGDNYLEIHRRPAGAVADQGR